VLRELRIENLLLIERAELRLTEGLNVITGETGAGKTVLAHALDLLMGCRARPQIVRPGAAEAWVEGVFDLPEGLLEEPEMAEVAERLPEDAAEIVLGRRVSAAGRTAAFVAGRAASAADLRLLGARLVAFYGQHEHRKLTIASAQAEVLDGFAGAEHLEILRLYKESHREHSRTLRELTELRDREGARERDLDLYRYELAEIEAAAPDPDEEGELGSERERLRHAESLRLAAAEAHATLTGDDEAELGASGALSGAHAALGGPAGVDAELDAIAERVGALVVELGDVGIELRSYLERLEADPGRLATIEERLDVLDRLKRKHGGSIDSVLGHAERCRAEISRLETAEGRGAELESRLAALAVRREELGAELSGSRVKAGRRLEKRVAEELAQLAIPGGRLEAVLEPDPDGFGPGGCEVIELRIATNPGIAPGSLREAASGGELSRVMLALIGLIEVTGGRTLVFDEIDAGVGGNTARVVGERLRALADGGQVVCITHLPQVASLATTHFRIEKSLRGKPATALVERIEGEELVEEICRMLGAESSDEAASRHARELLAA
jgi:DNA repair protein RecN (Recombination protein N)